jgi:hypothetical protein
VGFQVRRGADVVGGGLGVAEEVDHPGSCRRSLGYPPIARR